MGTVTLSEIAYTPRNVQATEGTGGTQVTVNWLAPDPNAVGITQSFEDPTFPPADWTQVVTNGGPANTMGVLPTWCRFGTVTSGTTTVTPSDGSWQCGFWWDYNHQDEWLITPQFNCPQGAYLSFETYAYRGSLNNDHYYVKVTNNSGVNWTVLCDASALTGGWNNYQTPVQIDLSAYAGQQIKLAWHADDPNATSDGMWYNWFIDNVVISNTVRDIRFSETDMTVKSAGGKVELLSHISGNLPFSRTGESLPAAWDNSQTFGRDTQTRHVPSRALIGYKVWRLLQGQEQNEATWTLLTPELITSINLTDTGWATLNEGTYKWAVKAIYTNNVLSLGAFSNALVKQPVPTGTLAGSVRNASNLPVIGATITAGAFTATTNTSGMYSLLLPAGTYSVTCSAVGYNSQTINNVVITAGQTVLRNFILSVGIEDEQEVVSTTLKGNYPNPFNPLTTIAYDVKNPAPVRIDIFNARGQHIRTLVNELKTKGHFRAVWDGNDADGKPVASGFYQYRMQAGDYKAVRRMMLLK